jgi:hypothetical protein
MRDVVRRRECAPTEAPETKKGGRERRLLGGKRKERR